MNHLLMETEDSFNFVTEKDDICSEINPLAHHPVIWRALFDVQSKAFYAEPVLNLDEYADIGGFLSRAWSKKEDSVFSGTPEILHFNQRAGSTHKRDVLLQAAQSAFDHGVDFQQPDKSMSNFGSYMSVWLKMMVDFYDIHGDLHEVKTAKELKEFSVKVQQIAFVVSWLRQSKDNICENILYSRVPIFNTASKVKSINAVGYLSSQKRSDESKIFRDIVLKELNQKNKLLRSKK